MKFLKKLFDKYGHQISSTVIFLLAVTALLPVLTKSKSVIYGLKTDPYATVWYNWWLKYSCLNNLDPLHIGMIAAPFGADYSTVIQFPVWNFINTHLSIFGGEVFAYNFMVFVSFLLSGVFMYALVYYLLKEKLPAFISGLIFMFCPYHFYHSWDHISLAQIQWLVLYIFSLLNLTRKRNLKNALLCGLAFSCVGFFDFYYLFYALIISFLFLAYLWYFRFKGKQDKKEVWINNLKDLKYAAVIILVSGIFLFPIINGILKNVVMSPSGKQETRMAKLYKRPFGQLFSDSAKPLDYLLPPVDHPITGIVTRPFLNTFLYGDNPVEHSLFLGLIPLLLSVYAFKKYRQRKTDFKNEREEFAFGFFVFLFFAAIIISMPPYIPLGKFFIPFPSFFLFKLFPMFRNYARFGIVAIICVAASAGYGMRLFLRGRGKDRYLWGGLICTGILFEFLLFPSFLLTDTRNVPPVYKWLKAKGGNIIIAEYPVDADERPYLFWQHVHEKRLINGVIKGSYADTVQKKIVDLDASATAGILNYLGVKYVLLHKPEYLAYEGGNILGRLPEMKSGFEKIRSFAGVEVYRPVAPPIDPDKVQAVRTVSVKQKAAKRSYHLGKNALSVNFHWQKGDRLHYRVSYMSFIPVFDLTIDVDSNTGCVIFKGMISGSRLISAFAKVKMWIESVFDPDSLLSLRYTENLMVEGKPPRERTTAFDQKNLIATTGDREVSIYYNTEDPLSALFYLSAQDVDSSREFAFYVNAGKTNYRLTGRFNTGRIKTVDVRGKPCSVYKGRIFSMKRKVKEIGSIKIFFEKDSKHTPLKMEILTKAGFFKIESVK